MSLLTPFLRVLSPSGKGGRLSILIFHRVHREIDPLFPGEPNALWFDSMLSWVKSWFNVLPLDEAVTRLKEGTLPTRAAAITFDDGYADNFHVALPLLSKHGLSATVFVATAFLDGGIMWNDAVIEMVRQARGPVIDLESLGLGKHLVETTVDRQSAISTLISRIKYLESQPRLDLVKRCTEKARCVLPENLMMTSEELRSLRRSGMAVGAHTRRHPILASLPADDAWEEITGSKAQLEEILCEPVSLFAYPNGRPGQDYLPDHVRMVREAGFSAAVSTTWGAADHCHDQYQLPRFTPWDRTELRFGLRLVGNILNSRYSSPATCLPA